MKKYRSGTNSTTSHDMKIAPEYLILIEPSGNRLGTGSRNQSINQSIGNDSLNVTDGTIVDKKGLNRKC